MRGFFVALAVLLLLTAAMIVGMAIQAPGLVLAYLCLVPFAGIAVGRASAGTIRVGITHEKKHGR